MIVTVPAAGLYVAPYQGIQLGSQWYISLDYINHHEPHRDEARTDPDGMLRFVISERDPGWPTGWSSPGAAAATCRSAGSSCGVTSRRTTGRRSWWCRSATFPAAFLITAKLR